MWTSIAPIARVFNFVIFPKNSQNLNLCECVFVSVCGYAYVCVKVTSQNNVIVASRKTQHRVLLFEM